MDSNLPNNYTLEQAEAIYQETRAKYEGVRKHYRGIIGKFRKNLRPKDNKTLLECIAALFPLSLEQAVQDEISKCPAGLSTPDTQFPLFYRISNLQARILLYASRFKNSGIQRIDGPLF